MINFKPYLYLSVLSDLHWQLACLEQTDESYFLEFRYSPDTNFELFISINDTREIIIFIDPDQQLDNVLNDFDNLANLSSLRKFLIFHKLI